MPATILPIVPTPCLSKPAVLARPAKMVIVRTPVSVLQVLAAMDVITKIPIQSAILKPSKNTAVLGVQLAVLTPESELKPGINTVPDTAPNVQELGAGGLIFQIGV